MGRKTQEHTFYEKYYAALKGATIVGTRVELQDGQCWPVIKVRMDNGDELELEVSRDSEGNGPGFLFGLPRPA